MGQDIHRFPVLCPGNLLDETQAVLPNHPAMFLILRGNLPGCAQSKINLFLGGLSFRDADQLSLNRPGQIDRRRPGNFESCRCIGYVLIKGVTFRCLDRRQVHAVSGARPDQPCSPDMHFADCGRHLLDRFDLLDHEPMR